MSNIHLKGQLSACEDRAGQWALQAIQAIRRGDQAAAQQAYQAAISQTGLAASTEANLAVFALIVGQAEPARQHASRALQRDARCVAAWINLSIAHLQGGQTEAVLEAAQQAVVLQPDHGIAQLNLGALLAAHGDHEAAQSALLIAARALPQHWHVQWELARVARARQQPALVRTHALAALHGATTGLPPHLTLQPARPRLDITSATVALCEAKAVLDAAGIGFFLMAGTLLALIRDNDLLPHDKDIDLGLSDDIDRDLVCATFEQDPRFLVPTRPASREPLWAFGVVHRASGVTIDLFFARHEPQGVRFGFGMAPSTIHCLVRPFELGRLHWCERDWPIPQPPERYLEDVYGSQWRIPDPYFDTALSNPSRCLESLPLAINLALLRLGDALQQCDWRRAQALCRQLLARDSSLVEVQGLQQTLAQRCPGLGE